MGRYYSKDYPARGDCISGPDYDRIKLLTKQIIDADLKKFNYKFVNEIWEKFEHELKITKAVAKSIENIHKSWVR